MRAEEIFRFPEEAERETALCALPGETLTAELERIGKQLPAPERYRREAERLRAILTVMEQEADRFLRTWSGKTYVFGGISDREGLYRDHCALQGTLEEGVRRLSDAATEPYPPAAEAWARWAVKRLAQGIVQDAAITDRAGKLLHRLTADDRARERTEAQRESVRAFLRTTVRAYGSRAPELSDAENRGRNLRAGALIALTAEFRTAIAECKKGLDERRKL